MKKYGPGFNIGTVRTLGVLVLIPLFAFGLVSVALGIAGGREPAAASSVVWNQQNFTSKTALDRWLKARGSSYKTWARRHPSLAGAFEPPASAAPARATTHHRHLLLGALATGMALLLLVAVRTPASRYRRQLRAGKRLLTHQTVTPAFAGAVRASTSFMVQAGSASSPYLRSAGRAGRQSILSLHDSLSSPQGRRTMRVVILYTAYAIFAIALGASVAIYFP